MAHKHIFTVGFELPGDEFEHVPFDSDQSLLDADIVLFEPSLGDHSGTESYNGKMLLGDRSSFRVKENLQHWHSEIISAVNAGKLVVVYLAKPIECFRYTGEKQFSGTGRSRSVTKLVAEVSSYEAVPNLKSIIPKTGKGIRLEKNAKSLTPYWKEFSEYSPYEAYIEGSFTEVLLKTRDGGTIVGAAIHGKVGNLLFLPPLRYEEKKFIRYNSRSDKSYWTEEARQFGARLGPALIALANALASDRKTTPPPSWVSDSRYRLAEEQTIERQISSLTKEIIGLQSQRAELEQALSKAGSLRRLLYEQGPGLEEAVLEALRILGFEAAPFTDGKSEFDAVFISPEGRFLGEAEGKDNRAINIDKMSQLERNLQEDFAREEISEFAKGVLFGNAFRLSPPHERGDFFTDKCVAAAKRTKVALVRTPDLFEPASYLKAPMEDSIYAASCREAILKAEGEIVALPAPPTEDPVVTTTAEIPHETQPEIHITVNPEASN